MTEKRSFLVFALEGPMAAFGKIAVGEQRGLWDAPSKSGVLGLVAGCLGLTRDQEEPLLELDSSLGFAVRVDRAGFVMRDFHTAQTPSEASRNARRKKGLLLETRRDDLACENPKDELKTVISDRSYRLEPRFTIALWNKTEAPFALEKIKAALRTPAYIPFLGRKSCPLGAPMAPCLLESETLSQALSFYDKQCICNLVSVPRQAPLWFEWAAGLANEEKIATQVRERRDTLRQRRSWLFSNRQEGFFLWTPEGAAA